MKTTNYQIPLLHQNQAHKEQHLNGMIELLDQLINKAIKDELTELPGSAENGSLFLITPVGEACQLALRWNDVWHRIAPQESMIFYSQKRMRFIIFQTGEWEAI